MTESIYEPLQPIKSLPEGFVLVEEESVLNKPLWMFVYSPEEGVYYARYLWEGVSEEKVLDLIKKGVMYAKGSEA